MYFFCVWGIWVFGVDVNVVVVFIDFFLRAGEYYGHEVSHDANGF